MQIDRVELRKIFLPFLSPFKTSGWTEEGNHSIIVKIQSEGLTGWGESPAALKPYYVEETTSTAWAIQKEILIPLLFKSRINKPEDVNALFESVRGNNIAKSGIEFAVWDLFGKADNKSISQLLGGTRKQVDVGVSIGIQEDIPLLLDTVEKYLCEGYKRVKLKIMPGFDVEPVKEVREKFPGILLQVDANSAYTLRDTEHLKQLDDYSLLLMEQPLPHDDIYEHSLLQKKLKTPLCLDESIISFSSAKLAISLKACRVLTIKACKLGGITAAKQIHDLAESNNIPVWCGGMLETGIGRAVNVQVASLNNFTLPGDISANNRYFKRDIVKNPFTLNSGMLDVPTLPGHGAEVDEEYLNGITLEKEIFTK